MQSTSNTWNLRAAEHTSSAPTDHVTRLRDIKATLTEVELVRDVSALLLQLQKLHLKLQL